MAKLEIELKAAPLRAAPPGPNPDKEELARVVVADERLDDLRLPWYVRLRAWLFCLMFLALAEAGARLYFDAAPTLRHERFDNFPSPASENAFVAQIRRDPAFRIVMIGDSVVVGPSLLDKDQTIPRHLENALQRALPGRDVHVWNLAVAGSRASDQYCLLKKVLEARPDMVIVEGNLMMFSSDIRNFPVANPWLAYNLPAVPPAVAPLLKPRDRKAAFEDCVTNGVEDHFRLYGLRQCLNALLFGVQPRNPINSPNPAVMLLTQAGKRLGRLKMASWRDRGLKAAEYQWLYSGAVRPGNMNGGFYPLILADLKAAGVPAFTYLTPQNPAMMREYFPAGVYHDSRRVAASYFADPAVPFQDYSDALPDRVFYDNDHLLAQGNRMLAERIARDAMPVIEQAAARKYGAAPNGQSHGS